MPDVQALAQQECVEWFVGDRLSQGFLEFRRLPNGLPLGRQLQRNGVQLGVDRTVRGECALHQANCA